MMYVGTRDSSGTANVQVVDGERRDELPLRLDLDNHSPTGFEWGYSGSGPAQLALALLAHATGNDKLAVRWHQEFKFKVIAAIHRDTKEWIMTRSDVLETFKRVRRKTYNEQHRRR